ncbi:MAG: MarR family transcriptional regulator [Candidatus Hodarchaeales archaeon]|jgi:DNA-binding transcriptional regulator GbsR (MarR family)
MIKDEKAEYYNEIIDKMEKRIQIFVHESCQVIYTYLNIYGKMTSKDLLEKLEFSRGTIFSSLKLLQDAGFVEKGINPKIKDERQNKFYYAKIFDIEIHMDHDFLNYIMKSDRLDVYKEYLKHATTITTGMIKTAEMIPVKRTLEKIESGKLPKKRTEDKLPIIHYIEINTMTDRKKLVEKINECIKESEEQIKKEERDFKEPLENPVAFSIFFIPLD